MITSNKKPKKPKRIHLDLGERVIANNGDVLILEELTGRVLRINEGSVHLISRGSLHESRRNTSILEYIIPMSVGAIHNPGEYTYQNEVRPGTSLYPQYNKFLNDAGI